MKILKYYRGYVIPTQKDKDVLVSACKGKASFWTSTTALLADNKTIQMNVEKTSEIGKTIMNYIQQHNYHIYYDNAYLIRSFKGVTHLILSNSSPSIIEEFIVRENDLALYAEGKEKTKQL